MRERAVPPWYAQQPASFMGIYLAGTVSVPAHARSLYRSGKVCSKKIANLGEESLKKINSLSSQPQISSYQMITRRNIRVKVMQTLYSLESQERFRRNRKMLRKILNKHFDQSGQLLIYMLYFLTELARYAEKDSLFRSSKHLPSQLDKNVNTKLAGNQLAMENAGTGELSEVALKEIQTRKYPAERIDQKSCTRSLVHNTGI